MVPGPGAQPAVLALTGLADASLGGAMVAAYRHSKSGAVAGTVVFIALTLCEWRLWVSRFTRETGPPDA